MTDKERLESIKEDVEIGIKVWGISIDDIKWLVEQAEKKIELEHSYKRTISKQNKQITALHMRSRRYKQALKDIRDINTGMPHKFAVNALKGESE